MKILGVTCGIASVGWGLLDVRGAALTIVAAGVWCFDPPEVAKTRTPLNAIRRLHRGQRRVIGRRRQRMNSIRRLFHEAGLLPDAHADALRQPGLDGPWRLRADAFDRRLSGPELAVALGHIAAHRGFRSNGKHQATNAADETSRMKKAIAANQAQLQHYRTVGLMFATDPRFEARKHNRGGDFTHSVLRADLEDEVRQIFAEQRRRDNALATPDLEAAFGRLAFDQRPLGDSEHLVGACRFEPGEKRTARCSYAYELFRLLSRLANVSLSNDGRHVRLDAAMIRTIADDFGAVKRITYRSVRAALSLDPSVRFVGISDKDEKNDIVARQGNAAEGSHALRRVVEPQGWQFLMQRPALRDRIAEVLTWRSDPASIRAGLLQAGLQAPLLDAVMAGVEDGAFSQFRGTGHLSAKAARALLPALQRGAGYYAACEAAGYDHDAPAKVALDDVRNPVARNAAGELLKQISAVSRAYGQPDAIHIGLQREVGKSAEERDQISRGIEARNKKREASRLELEALLARSTQRGELLRYELWKEQGGRCLYTDTYIDPSWIAVGDNAVQVGHILPWSRFGDDSFPNKTLCLASAAQAKQDRTPYEWFGASGLNWAAFSARVEACKDIKPGKKRGFYLRQNAAEIEAAVRNRQLSDTRYISRLLLLYLGQIYPGVKVRARSTQLTAKLRRAWGLDDLKHDADGSRRDDMRHRAVDALVLAAISERTLEDLANAAREAERQGSPRGFDFSLVEPPAEGFRDVVRDVTAGVFVARAERRRVGGELHAATIKRIRLGADGAPTVFERKAIEQLTLGDLEYISTPVPYGRVHDPGKLRDDMVANLRQWIEQGRPKDCLPCSPKGDIIRKVRVATGEEVRVLVRGGTADRGEMARVDVFRKVSKNGKPGYYLVPVYPHQIADRQGCPRPPDRAVVAGMPEFGWAVMDADATFLFSLFSHSLVEVAKSDGAVVLGYFKGLDRANGAIAIALPENLRAPPVRTGAKTLHRFDKLRVDRLGVIKRVKQEVRTWHGVACM
jgi:CRISPR-associated endonuclease Csn1